MLPPLDSPNPGRPRRIYFALTNHCNRGCPWCSTCSSPSGRTFLGLQQYRAHFPSQGPFQVQLEGGEPTTHPEFAEFVKVAREHPQCQRLVICTNGVLLPRQSEALSAWLDHLGPRSTVKLSVNHFLLARDSTLLDLAQSIRDKVLERNGDQELVVNIRLRRGVADDDRAVALAAEGAGLMPFANVFFLQRYGFAEGETGWSPPHLVWSNFTLINPDGRDFGQDLIRRSAAMRELL